MKKILLSLLMLVSLNVIGQNDFFKVKENSFHQIEGFMMFDRDDHRDLNNRPMALIKISTENITAEERRRITFKGNIDTSFDVHLEPSEIYLYISAKSATFIEIHHPDYGKTEFVLPYDLKEFCGYEMVLQYIPIANTNTAKPQNTYLVIKSDQDKAVIYINDKMVGTKEVSEFLPKGKTYDWKIVCKYYHTEEGSIILDDKVTINKTLRPNYGFLNINSQPEQGAQAFVDGEFVGITPFVTDRLMSGDYKVSVMKDMYKMTEQNFTVKDGETTDASINMQPDFVEVTINCDIDTDIYVDELYKGRGSWSGRLSDGSHYIEARKDKHTPSSKNVNLVLGKPETINLDSPKPLVGFMNIRTNPMEANVFVDGKQYGTTPNMVEDLLIGSHELMLEKKGYVTITRTINITEGETLTLDEILQSEMGIAAKQFEIGKEFYDRHEFAKAVEHFHKAAELGHADAQCALGYYYFEYALDPLSSGEDETPFDQVRFWISKAAEQGIADAQKDLGVLYEALDEDYSKAMEWYLKAAEQGNVIAMMNIGNLYASKVIGKRDPEEAMKWYRKSAEQGYVGAMHTLAEYYSGWWDDVPEDMEMAYKWYEMAAEKGEKYRLPWIFTYVDKEEEYKLGLDYYNDQDYSNAKEHLLKAAELGHAEAQYVLGNNYLDDGYDLYEAFSWYFKAAKQGVAYAMGMVAQIYEYGIEDYIKPDESKANEWYLKAAEQFREDADKGDAESQFMLGELYCDGYGVEQDYSEAAIWYRKAAEQGHAVGQNNLAWCYYNGYGVTKDYKEALKWYRKAVEQDNAGAKNGLGNCYYYGYGVAQNYKEAVKWYRESAQQEFPKAQYSLGRCYEYGHGVEQDLIEAKKWYQKAADNGYKEAEDKLKEL